MAEKSSSFKWIVLVALVFGSAILNYSNMIFASRPVDVMAMYNMSQAQLTAISTIGVLPGALFSIVLGRFFDKRGSATIRFVGAGMLFLGAACQLWRVFAGSYVEIFIITFLSGTFFLPTQVLPAKVIEAWFDRKENALAMGVFGAAAGIGITLTFAVGNLFATTTIALLSCAVGFLCAALLWIAFVKMPASITGAASAASMASAASEAKMQTSTEDVALSNASDASASTTPSALETAATENAESVESIENAAAPRISVKAVLTSKTMLLVMLCSAFASGAPLFLNSYLVNAFLAKGMSEAGTSMLGVVFNICLVIGAILAGAISSRAGKFNGLYLVLGIVGGAFLLLTYLAPVGILTYCCLGIAGLFSSGALSLNMGRIALIPLTGDFGSENIGIAGGMNNTAMGVGMFIIPTISALFVGSNYLAVFITVLVFFVFIGLVGGLLIPELGEKGKLAQAAAAQQTV